MIPRARSSWRPFSARPMSASWSSPWTVRLTGGRRDGGLPVVASPPAHTTCLLREAPGLELGLRLGSRQCLVVPYIFGCHPPGRKTLLEAGADLASIQAAHLADR